jgi:3',5'-cyclic AMP phosphodiesterase CpdA
MQDRIAHGPNSDGIDRRGFLHCMAWAGTGMVWAVHSGILGCQRLDAQPAAANAAFTFVQVSDSHIGFSRDPNRNVAETYREAIARINALSQQPAFILHTGDLTHLATPEEFDIVDQLHRTLRTREIFTVPGEHDLIETSAERYLQRFGRGTRGNGWRSFDYQGVHFVGLVNVTRASGGGLGQLGQEQLDWLRQDLAGKGDSTPIVVFAHVPLWSVFPRWGWGTEDSGRALELLARFGSVTVLNGHVHQILQRVEGRVTFHTARSTAFPQPEPGAASSPGPIRDLPADRLRNFLGVTRVRFIQGDQPLAITDETLA